MKKKCIVMVLICCLLHCVTALASDMIIGVNNANDISMVYVECGNYNMEFTIVEQNEIKQMYDTLMNMPIDQSMPKADYFKTNQYTSYSPWDRRNFYTVRVEICKNMQGKEFIVEKEFTVNADKIYNDDWVFTSGSSDIGKENEFYKYIDEKAKTKQKYLFDLEKSDMYQNHVFVENEKLHYQWGKPYFNKYNQLMVPFKELKTALQKPSSTYNIKTQMVTIGKNEPVALYGEVIDDVIYVPVRTFAEMCKYYTYWDNELKIVLLTKNENIELWNRRNIYPPQSRIVTEEYTLNLSETMSYEKSEFENDTIYFYDYKTGIKVGEITKYIDLDDRFNFKQEYEEKKLGSITDHFLDLIGIQLYGSKDLQMMSGDSNYADFEIWVGSTKEDFNMVYYFFVNGKNIYVISFDEMLVDGVEQEKIVSTFEYR